MLLESGNVRHHLLVMVHNLSNLPAGAPVGGASTNTVFFENDNSVDVSYTINIR